jgi:uncharacterized protein (DUF1499 family)
VTRVVCCIVPQEKLKDSINSLSDYMKQAMQIITLLVLMAPTHAMEGEAHPETETQQLMDKLLDKMVDKFINQGLKLFSIHHRDLDDTELALGSFKSLTRTRQVNARGPLGHIPGAIGNRFAPIHAVSRGSSEATPVYPADSPEFPPALLSRRELASAVAAMVSGAAALEASAEPAPPAPAAAAQPAPAPAPAPPAPPPPPPTLNKACDSSAKFCVSSEGKGSKVAPFPLVGDRDSSFKKLALIIKRLPQAKIDSSTPDSISATILRETLVLGKSIGWGDGGANSQLWHTFYVKVNFKYDPDAKVIQVQAESTDPTIKKTPKDKTTLTDDTGTSKLVVDDLRGLYVGFPKAAPRSPRYFGEEIPALKGWTGIDWGATKAFSKSGKA